MDEDGHTVNELLPYDWGKHFRRCVSLSQDFSSILVRGVEYLGEEAREEVGEWYEHMSFVSRLVAKNILKHSAVKKRGVSYGFDRALVRNWKRSYLGTMQSLDSDFMWPLM